MIDIEEVARGIYRLETLIPGEHTVFTVYFIKGDSDAIIDPGPASIIPDIEAAVKKLSLNNVEYIIPTHIHLDHAGGLGRLIQVFPQAKAVVNAHGARHAIDPARLVRSTKISFGENFASLWGEIAPVPESRIRVVHDGDKLNVGGRQLTIFETPGHAPHHIAILDSETRGLFCGEVLGLVYLPDMPPLPAVTPPNFNLNAYLSDMERLRALKPKVLYYAHGTVGRQPEILISAAVKSTHDLNGVVRRAMRDGKDEKAVIDTAGDYLQQSFGQRPHINDLTSIIRAFIEYHKKRLGQHTL